MKTKSELSDLWNGVLRGEAKAFELLHQELYPIVYRSILKSTKDEGIARDLMQDLFIRLWLKRFKIGNIDFVKQYFLVSARSVVVNHFRKKSVTTLSLFENALSLCDPSPENVMIEKETDLMHIKNFSAAFLDLPDRQRELLYMKFHNGCSHYEIEAKTGIRYQSIANYLYRATTRLKSAMGEIERPGIYFILVK